MGRSLQGGVLVVQFAFFVLLPVSLVASNHFYPVPEARQRDRQPAGGLPAGASGFAARCRLQNFVLTRMAAQNLHHQEIIP